MQKSGCFSPQETGKGVWGDESNLKHSSPRQGRTRTPEALPLSLRKMFVESSREDGGGVKIIIKKTRRATGEEMSLLLLPAGHHCGREVIPL